MINKHKDRNPKETISKVRSFLYENDIFVTEDWTVNEVGLFSVNLKIEGTNLTVNGKGTTKAFSLASAYGELVERLQNLAFFRFNSHILIKDNDCNVDCIVEKKVEQYEVLLADLDKVSKGALSSHDAVDTFIQRHKIISNSSKIKCMTFTEIDSENELVVPIDAIDFYYGTNGMSAGNTSEETLVQAISEILERYVSKILLNGDIVPPIIDKETMFHLKNFDKINSYIDSLKTEGGFDEVHLLDLSLGLGLPVVGVLLIRKNDASYFVKIGAHPQIEIAVERCFTELLQGRKINNFLGMKKFNDSLQDYDEEINASRFYVNGEGFVPYKIFTFKPTYNSTLKLKDYKNNKEMLEFLVNLIYEMGYRIYINDTSTKILNSYHVIIPGISEMYHYSEKIMKRLLNVVKLGSILENNLSELNEEQSISILKILDELKVNDYTTIDVFLRNASMKKPNLYSETHVIILKFYLNIILKRYKDAKTCADNFNRKLKEENKMSVFFECYSSYLALILKDFDKEDIISILKKFYSEATIKSVLKDFNTYPFKDFSPLDIMKKEEISYQTLEKQLYSKTKELLQ